MKKELDNNETNGMNIKLYSEHCPFCDSENIKMIGDPEFNDEWECEDCEKIFSSFRTKIN